MKSKKLSQVMRKPNSLSPMQFHAMLTRPDEDGNIRYRKLGLIVARGTLLVVISPVDGSEEIANPFLQEEE